MTVAGFTKVGVIGAGQMGAGIAQVCATSGLEVILYDISDPQLKKADDGIKKSLAKFEEKKLLTSDDRVKATKLLRFSHDWDALKDCDLVVEAIVENEKIKTELFVKLDQLLKPSAIIASNTSSIPITRLAASTKRPQNFIGMHFMNPVPLMKLIEVISGFATSPETTERVISLATALGKEVTRSQDYPGFVVNRILMPMINEAFNVLLENVASAEDIDRGMKLGTNQPMGPLTLADFIGLDTCLAIIKVLYEGTLDPRFRPSPLLTKYVEAGYFGRKTKRGVFKYD